MGHQGVPGNIVPTQRSGFWFGDPQKGELTVIDTPGFGDPEGRDAMNMERLVQVLREIRFVKAFVVVLNS